MCERHNSEGCLLFTAQQLGVAVPVSANDGPWTEPCSQPHSCGALRCVSLFPTGRYVNHLDTVPELPPFDSFRQVPHGMWLRDDLVLLQARVQRWGADKACSSSPRTARCPKPTGAGLASLPTYTRKPTTVAACQRLRLLAQKCYTRGLLRCRAAGPPAAASRPADVVSSCICCSSTLHFQPAFATRVLETVPLLRESGRSPLPLPPPKRVCITPPCPLLHPGFPLRACLHCRNDHHCDQLYVPQILNATAVTVPGFIYTTGPA